MRPKAILVVLGLFLLAVVLLSLGPAGYEKVGSMQSLPARTAAIRKAHPGVEHLAPDTLEWIMRSEARLLLVDARPPDEYEVSRIDGALNLESVSAVENHLAEVEDPPEVIVVYGSVGKRSAKLAERLQSVGHAEARNLAGSIFQWANEGRGLVDSAGEPVDVVHPGGRFQSHLLEPARRANGD
ncbi:MAG: rhodanese-like domain-containing protein [Verrucomicrobiales bacterium]